MDYTVFYTVIIIVFFLMLTGLMLVFSVVSYGENEPGAGARFLACAVLLAAIGTAAGLLSYPGKEPFAAALITITILLLVLFFRNPVNLTDPGNRKPSRNVDENDVIFSRMRLRPGTEEWNDYYSSHKTEEAQDAISRRLPGLLSESAKNYNPLTFRSADANFDIIGYLQKAVREPRSDKTTSISPEILTRYLKGWAVFLGAYNIGICELRDHHLYTVRGRGEEKGKPVIRSHKYAIAFTVEMDHRHMQSAPSSPAVFESSQRYLNSATIALQIAAFLKKSGWESRAHIDGDYEVICPLVARDAGLGDIGRMGLLMTPGLGPRVRIAVVTTDAPLVTDRAQNHLALVRFCTICRKCAECCPARCIPYDDMKETEGVARWKIDHDLCYRYWCSSGTDCGRCVAVCPFSHPDNVMHNMIRRYIQRSFTMARLALLAENFFYGRKPASSDIPLWMKTE